MKWPNSEVFGIDGSKEMILRAEFNKEISKNQRNLKNFTLENGLSSLEVFEDGDNYLIVYGNV